MGFLSVLGMAQQLVSRRLQPGGRAVDATVGTGADTLFLARTAGRRGRVFGFDVQEQALRLARERLDQARLAGERLGETTLLLASHAEMAEAVPADWRGAVDAVMFNLGYLPDGSADKTIITEASSTLAALNAALSLLAPRGVLTAVVYPGHEGGEAEATAVRAWAEALSPKDGQSIVYRQLQRPEAPYLIAVERSRLPL
ncbi:class I SAM-dependent methyltransferase [Paenibacillus glufosinatiresistens]|uniref:class I SAM-dependent methyltransferase n=1 Tax=Paenibacillus glufosinatiresistens TaxID=3070657 RepID=UPI00286E49FF|nr:class I SAM-dependent methyltransferase [Paenibacillus sp. YX.27]